MDIGYWLSARRDGLTLELTGFVTTRRGLFQLPTLPFVVFFRLRNQKSPLPDPALDFSRCMTRQETVLYKLAQALNATKKNITETVEVMMSS